MTKDGQIPQSDSAANLFFEFAKGLGSILAGSIFASLGIFCAITIWHIAWGIVTPGDVFGNVGGPLLFGSSFAAAFIGGIYAGAKGGLRLRIAILLLAIASASYWGFVPSGWWVTPPPGGG